MRPRQLLIAAVIVGGLVGASVPASADPSVMMPRGPTFSMNDPIFKGLLLSPGFSKCRELRGRTYEWKCTYGDVPADPNGRLSGKWKQLRAAKPGRN